MPGPENANEIASALRSPEFTAALSSARMHPLTLRFSDRSLERAFLEQYAAAAMPVIRRGTLLAALLYGGFGIWDVVVVPEHHVLYWAIRYLLVCPTFVAGFVLTYVALFRRVYQPLLGFGVAVASGGIIVMIVTGPEELMLNFGYVPLIMILTFGYVMVKMRFTCAAGTALLVFVAFEIALLSFENAPFASYVTSNETRGEIEVKGKGKMRVYFLIRLRETLSVASQPASFGARR